MNSLSTIGIVLAAGMICATAQTEPAQPQDPTSQAPATPVPRVTASARSVPGGAMAPPHLGAIRAEPSLGLLWAGY